MEFEGIHHIAIIGHDKKKTLAFYVTKLGFKIIAQHQRTTKKDIKIDLQKNNLMLEVFIKPAAPARSTYPEGEACGLRHLAFAVPNVDQTVIQLKKVGIMTEPVRRDDYTGKKMTFFFDPDGLPLEIHE
ncbi:VOC family protein [Liquorilactobacillus capillatus]|uniref:VOC domain-containing protein n=1 Tax=Liquorilactobacillus capillatus DSM 19910 TaxID=1423731 RepID=A0A0R1MDV4_9LACO|nr:VOC family protein [Liquorilactobacillus capillatus]KRL01672.1 hypothetical protein FC81_GL001162 [Liquorilactobacillus capillatus DSM 19910]